jgi:O-antigen ligase
MYSFTTGEGEKLLGLNYSYYILPLFFVNILICLSGFRYIQLSSISKYVFLWLIVVTLNVILISSHKVTYLIRVNIWTTTFFSAFCLARTNKLTQQAITRLFLIIYVISFYYFWQGKAYQQYNMEMGLEGSSNAVYCLVTLIPVLMFLKNKRLSFIILFITLVCTVFSNKRGATIIMVLIILPLISNIFGGIKNRILKYIIIIGTVVVMVFSLYYIGNTYVEGRLVERFNQIEETGGSGRTEIWGNILTSYQSSSTIEQMLGHGHYAVNEAGFAGAAHNDFVEVLYDYGVVGLLFYLLLHLCLIRKAFVLWKARNPVFNSFLAMYLIFITMSMVSILIVQERYLIYMAVYWGMLEGYDYNIPVFNKIIS